MFSAISRRTFLQRSLAAGGVLVAGTATGLSSLLPQPRTPGEPWPDLAVITGDNVYQATVKAVETLGGIRRFVKTGDKIGVLVNSRFNKPGTFVRPEITLALIALSYDAGAKEVVSLEDVDNAYWRKAASSGEMQSYIRSIKRPRAGIACSLTGAHTLKTIEITRDYFECDAVMNIAIFKDHEGTRFTGVLKNLMGATTGETNRSWHLGSGASKYYDDIGYLSRCIADGNLCRRPSLCIGDATQVLLQNGPFGPGPTWDFRTIVAGANPVSVDAMGASILGFTPTDILMIRYAAELGLGNDDLSTVRVKRENI